jgi:serine/threonine protein kinase
MNNPLIIPKGSKNDFIVGLNRKKEVMSMLLEGGDVHESISGKVFCCVLSGNCSFSTVKELGEKGKVGVPYILEIGDKKYIAKVSDYNPVFKLQTITNPIQISSKCFNKQPITAMGLDEYTNEVIIGYVISDCMEKNGMITNGHDFALTQSASSICDSTFFSKGISITPYISSGSLNNIATAASLSKYREEYDVVDPIDGTILSLELVKPEIINTVISQIVTALYRLSTDIQFSSGDLKPDNILISEENVKGSYQIQEGSIDVSGPIKCKIADYGKSSCSIVNSHGDLVRIYNSTRAADLYLYFQPFEPKIYSDPMVKGEHYYIVDDFTVIQIYAVMRHNKISYYKYFDYYVFMISFLAIPQIYYSFFGTLSLTKKFWQSMWITEVDAINVQSEIRDYVINNKKVGAHEAIDILKNKKLRCSILNHIFGKNPISYSKTN